MVIGGVALGGTLDSHDLREVSRIPLLRGSSQLASGDRITPMYKLWKGHLEGGQKQPQVLGTYDHHGC